MKTTQFWEGDGGNAYTARNRVDWRARMPFWEDVIEVTGVRSVFEFGCNAGWNLSAIRRLYPDIKVSGTDCNLDALAQTAATGIPTGGHLADLTFTAGVLIHIAPKNLEAQMRYMKNRSYDYVLAIEYESEKEEEIEYRGEMGLLWKRPYGELYQDIGLKLVNEGEAQGYDNCHYWLLRK